MNAQIEAPKLSFLMRINIHLIVTYTPTIFTIPCLSVHRIYLRGTLDSPRISAHFCTKLNDRTDVERKVLLRHGFGLSDIFSSTSYTIKYVFIFTRTSHMDKLTISCNFDSAKLSQLKSTVCTRNEIATIKSWLQISNLNFSPKV